MLSGIICTRARQQGKLRPGQSSHYSPLPFILRKIWREGVRLTSRSVHDRQHNSYTPASMSSPEFAFLLDSTKNTNSGHFQKQEVRKSRTSVSSTQAHKFETTVVVNGYKNGPSLRLCIKWKWPRVLGADQKKSGLLGRD